MLSLSKHEGRSLQSVLQPAMFRGWKGIALAGVAGAALFATITVDRLDDSFTATACTAAANDCSLRGATIFANANPGTTINLPAGTYNLTTDGSAEVGFCLDEASGDLNIAGNNTWSGPIIMQGNTSVGAEAGSSLTISGTVYRG